VVTTNARGRDSGILVRPHDADYDSWLGADPSFTSPPRPRALTPVPSPFYQIPSGQWLASNPLAFAIRDKYPVTPGHTLVIPKRVVATWWEATADERAAIWALVDEVKRRLDGGGADEEDGKGRGANSQLNSQRPDGYNVGFNAGEAAGQTVFHLHVHVIPRYRGDVSDPRGGVRWVVPERANYLAETLGEATAFATRPEARPVTDPPTHEAQLAFLAKLQRLFAEGDFTATYKFALMISLVDLAIEHGQDDGEPLRLANSKIAESFIELYWQPTAPYSTGREGTEAGVLAQNHGTQAAIVNAIAEFRQQNPAATPQSARSADAYGALLQEVTRTVAAQPINYLQNLGGQTDPFLYERTRGAVLLQPGVGFCLRRFQPLVQQLARSHWVAHVKRNKLNHPFLGETDDLESFLFETPRQALDIISRGLRLLTNDRCFYCGFGLNDAAEADVDHFVPFSMYPRDLMHNFVLAHPACNRSKSDTLAARVHLERWVEYVERNDDALREIGEEAGRVANREACKAVAK